MRSAPLDAFSEKENWAAVLATALVFRRRGPVVMRRSQLAAAGEKLS